MSARQVNSARAIQGVTAVILAGGLGTRLRSVVSDQPKVLAPVLGRPFLFYLLDQLSQAVVSEVVLLVGYKAEQVQQAIGGSYKNLAVTCSVERRPLGTAGAVRAAVDRISSSTFFLLNGDSYCDVNLSELLSFHHERRSDVCISLSWVADTSRFGRVTFDSRRRVRSFHEKRESGGPGWINAGVYVLNKDLIVEVPADKPVSLEREMFPGWLETKQLGAFPSPEPFIDIGTPESYELAESFFLDGP